VRESVKFETAINNIIDAHHNVFIETGPHPVLRSSIKQCISDKESSSQWACTLNKKELEIKSFIKSVATLYTLGVDIDWSPFGINGKFIQLPKYPWQKQLLWKETEASRKDRLYSSGNVFMNTRLITPNPSWEVELNPLYFPFLEDHTVSGKIVFPGAGYVAAGIEIFRSLVHGNKSAILRNVCFKKTARMGQK
jgi:acyl transferase domain-containing protein